MMEYSKQNRINNDDIEWFYTYFSVAVAVKPMTGTPNKTLRSLSNCLYSTLQKK